MKITLYLVVLIEFMFQSSCFSQKKINWRIYDQDFNKVTEVKTKDISIAHDLIWFEAGGKYGVMDIHNNILIKPRYEKVHHYQGGFTSVGTKNCFGMVYKGKEILPLKYSYPFSVDTSGYFIAQQGCSENPEAYIISDYSIRDTTGKLISQACEDDINSLFIELTKRPKKSYDAKKISNGFTIKLMPADQKYIKKGIYDRQDSLIFSCVKCRISDNANGEFLISQTDLNSAYKTHTYSIDTLGTIQISGNYNWLRYDQKHNIHLYGRGNEKGIVAKGNAQTLVKTKALPGVQVISKNRFLLSVDSLNSIMFTICDSLGIYLFAPTKDLFQVVNSNCLIHKTANGYMFTDANGKPVSGTYDSVFAIPDFNYIKMVLGDKGSRIGFGSDVQSIGPLDRDGFSPVVITPMTGFYGIVRGGKMGLFKAEGHSEIFPQYLLVARVNEKLFVARKDNQWLTINDNGDLKPHRKSKYINFFENYILIGN